MAASLVLTGGKVLTVDDRTPQAEAVAVVGDRIVAVGDGASIRTWIGAGTQVVDLRGRTLLPGFNDAHNHMLMFGQVLEEIDGSAVTSVRELAEEVRQRVVTAAPDDWVRGWGYDDTRLDERRHPTRHDLDRVSDGRPVVITRTCGHIAVANSRALTMAGIGRDTLDPPGGQIDRDPATGEPTGVLRENAKALLERAAPRPTRAQLVTGLQRANAIYVREGITSQQDMGTGNLTLEEELGAWQAARAAGAFQVRSCVSIRYLRDLQDGPTRPALLDTGLLTGFGDDRLRLGALKYFMDGGIGGATAYLSEPYAHAPSARGILCLEQPAIDTLVAEAHELGYQVAVHAIGDAAVTMIITALERALARRPRPGHRHRIEHCALTAPGVEHKLKALGIVPVPQPPFLYFLGDTWACNLGAERMAWAFPLRRWLDAGLRVPLSSDRPVVYSSPLANMSAAVNRMGRSGQVFSPEQAVTVAEAIRMHTLDAAYAAGEEDRKGSITPGKLADFVVLGADPLRVPSPELSAIPVEMTIIGGEIVYAAANF